MRPQITRKGASGFRPKRPSRTPACSASVAAGGVVLAEILQVLVRLHGRLLGGVVRLVARQRVGGAAEELADVAAEDGHHPDGRDGDEGDDDQVFAHALPGLRAEKRAEEAAHRRLLGGRGGAARVVQKSLQTFRPATHRSVIRGGGAKKKLFFFLRGGGLAP